MIVAVVTEIVSIVAKVTSKLVIVAVVTEIVSTVMSVNVAFVTS